jgi:hypothetical protein
MKTTSVPYQRKRKPYGTRKYYSVISKLESEGRINEQTQLMFNRLSLEEVIAVKLELAAKASGGHIYGIPLWTAIVNIARDAMLKFAISATRTKTEAARFLGMNLETFNVYLKQYDTENYFDE